MFIFFLPILFAAGYALAESSSSRDARPAQAPSRDASSPPSPVVGVANARATPLAAVNEYLARGVPPPPQLAEWAVAEAQALGRPDVAGKIYHAFVAPFLTGPAPHVSVPVPHPGDHVVYDMAQQTAQAAEAQAAQAGAPPPGVVPPGVVIDVDPGHPHAPQGAIAVAPSPIKGVSDEAWGELCRRLRRADPASATSKRIGQYQQSRTRLAQLGFDAEVLLGNPEAQDQALAADLSEGLARARAAGLLAAISQVVEIPQMADPPPITLSGLLGLIAVGGIDGARGWLTQPEDRQRFPYTTNLFLQTNGVF